MGICESSDLAQNTLLFKKELQPYNARIDSTEDFSQNNQQSIFSQPNTLNNNDIKKQKSIFLYKYQSRYGKNDEQTTLMTESLFEMNNSMNKTREKYSRDTTNIEETLNESSSQVFEIISDGKLDKDKIKKINDKSTIDNYIEYIDNTNEIKNTKIDLYSNKKQEKNKMQIKKELLKLIFSPIIKFYKFSFINKIFNYEKPLINVLQDL